MTSGNRVDEVAERWSPEPSHTGALLKLRAIVEEESGSRFVMAIFGDSAYRDLLIDHLATLMEHDRVLDIGDMRDFDGFDEALTDACRSSSLVHVTGARAWLSDEDRAADFLHGLNYRRERLSARCGATVVFWLDEHAVQRVAHDSPDFWAWRAGLLNFVKEVRLAPKITEQRIEPGRGDEQEMRRRLEGIRSYLEQHDEPHSSHVLLLQEMSGIEESLGELDEAEKNASEARRLAVHYGDRLNEAEGWSRIADIRETRGDLEEALRIRREEQLPVYERLGDVRLRAVTLQKIVSGLLARDGLTQENTRPIYDGLAESFAIFKRLDEPAGIAHVGVQLADLLVAIGKRDDALGVLIDVEPAFERLGSASGLSRVAKLRQRIDNREDE